MLPKISIARSAPSRVAIGSHALTTEMWEARSGDLPWELLKANGFEAKAGQSEIVLNDDNQPVVVVGMGASDAITLDSFRTAGAVVARAAKKHSSASSSVLDIMADASIDVDGAAATQAHVEGLILGSYVNGLHKSDRDVSSLKKVTVVTSGPGSKGALDKGVAMASATCWARDLVNEPGGLLTPTEFAQRAKKMATEKKLTCKVLDLAAIKKAKLGGLLGVNRGSSQQPRLVELSYRPTGKAKGHLVLVGKGITFDAGGLSIKTALGMSTMKQDMGGGAAVLGAMAAVADLKPAVRVTAIVPMTDNMLGPDATRPGDVLRMRNGKTVEVLNTDAEGRLILADGLSLASEDKPDAIIDAATLTGAAKLALGPAYAALMGNNEPLKAQIGTAGDTTNERVWPMPLPKEYRSSLDSSVADLKNIGTSDGGALVAGLFLQEFVADGIPWAHIDIAGTAFSDSASTLSAKGATGYGARLLAETAINFDAKALAG